jgi:hypothetical protein
MKDGVNRRQCTEQLIKRADSDGVAHPFLAPSKKPTHCPTVMMRSVTDRLTGSRKIHSVYTEKLDRTPREECGSRIVEPCPTSTGRPAEPRLSILILNWRVFPLQHQEPRQVLGWRVDCSRTPSVHVQVVPARAELHTRHTRRDPSHRDYLPSLRGTCTLRYRTLTHVLH